MEINAFNEEHGNCPAWDKYSNNSNTKGDWLKALGKGKRLFSFKARTGKKAEENAIKKLKNGINILSVENQGSEKQHRYDSDSSNTPVAPKSNHGAVRTKSRPLPAFKI
eukprot:7316345-Ditylum_brightwellii.AAC.1